LFNLLASRAAAHPDSIVFHDQPDGERWTGRVSGQWSAAFAFDCVCRLASYFASLDLPERAPLGICLTGGAEATLVLLAAERAGLIPFFLPLTANWAEVARQIEAAGIQAVVTQARAGEQRPSERMSEIAAGYFRLRFLMAFGPDVSDGVVDLDEMVATAGPKPTITPTISAVSTISTISAISIKEPGLISLPRYPGARPVYRPSRSLVAASAAILVSAGIRPGDRLLTLLAPDDLRGLATGPVAALLTGASLETHGVFDAATLLASLESDTPTHLVAPGWLEPALARLDLPESIATLILVHDAPVRFRAHNALQHRVVDVLAFDETALIAGARTQTGLFTLSLDAGADGGLSDLLSAHVDQDATVSFRGLAANVSEVGPADWPNWDGSDEWHVSRFKADLFAGIVIGVS
jgi:hypothetical protein